MSKWLKIFCRMCGYNKSRNVFIGMRSIVLSGETGVTIGEGAIIGAGSLVNKDVPDFTTAVGVACKVIKNGDIADE